VIGDRDVENKTVSVRLRTDEDKGAMSLVDFGALLQKLTANNSLELFPEA